MELGPLLGPVVELASPFLACGFLALALAAVIPSSSAAVTSIDSLPGDLAQSSGTQDRTEERSFEPFQPTPNDFFEVYPDGTRPPWFTARQSGNKRSADFQSAFGGRLGQSRLQTGAPTAAESRQAKKDSQESGESETVATVDLAGAIAPASGQPAGALTGRIVFAGAGHGWTYLNANKTWTTQRGVNNEMMEDYGNLDQMTLFAFYCFNAGATVVPTRPIGHQTNDLGAG